MHVVPGVYPLTVKPHGADSVMFALGGDATPLVQVSVTAIVIPLSGMKFLETVNVATAWLTIVQMPVVIVAMQLPAV
jgi:hypothetical protein